MSQPNYDTKTYRHIVETKFVEKPSSENPLQLSGISGSQPIILNRKPHHPQYSQKNKRYECGCGFVGDTLDFEIIPTSMLKLKTQKRIYTAEEKRKARNTIHHEPRRYIKMVGSELVTHYV